MSNSACHLPLGGTRSVARSLTLSGSLLPKKLHSPQQLPPTRAGWRSRCSIRPSAEHHRQKRAMAGDTPRKRGKWSPDEDARLTVLVNSLGPHWMRVSAQMGDRNDKQCRNRWLRSLNPALSFAAWTPDEDAELARLYALYGPSWTRIAAILVSRSDVQCRRRYAANLGGEAKKEEGRLASLKTEVGGRKEETPAKMQGSSAGECEKRSKMNGEKLKGVQASAQGGERDALIDVSGQMKQVEKQIEYLEKEKESLAKQRRELRDAVREPKEHPVGGNGGDQRLQSKPRVMGHMVAAGNGLVEEELLDCDLESELLQVTGSLPPKNPKGRSEGEQITQLGRKRPGFFSNSAKVSNAEATGQVAGDVVVPGARETSSLEVVGGSGKDRELMVFKTSRRKCDLIKWDHENLEQSMHAHK